MSKKTWPVVLTALLMLGLCSGLQAQSRTKKKAKSKKEEKENPIKNHLWYGFGPQIGFSGYNGTNVFTLGFAPMVGYKIIPAISVGPRLSVVFNNYKTPGYKATWFTDLEAGGFLRAKVFRGLFLQGEMSNAWEQYPVFGVGPKLDRITQERVNQRIGGGWNGGVGGWSSEFGIFYNFAIADDINTYLSPFEYRLNLTYKF